jgi:DeoR/GlpR family transcriptional regulator of sugar metabolism
VHPDGRVMNTTVIEIPVKRAMIAASDQVILLADSAKFPGRGMASVCGPVSWTCS